MHRINSSGESSNFQVYKVLAGISFKYMPDIPVLFIVGSKTKLFLGVRSEPEL